MKTVQQIMQETGAEANIRNFRYMQENYSKKRHCGSAYRRFETMMNYYAKPGKDRIKAKQHPKKKRSKKK